MKISQTAVAAGVALALSSGFAQAASIQSQLFSQTLFEDDSAEEHLDVGDADAPFALTTPDGTIVFEGTTPGANILNVGDKLRGILRITKLVEDVPGGAEISLLDGSGNHELAGVFETQVVGMFKAGSLLGGTPLPWDGGNTADFLFGPSATFATEFDLPTGAMVALFEDPTHEFAIGGCTTGSGGSCEANITDGSLFSISGMPGLGDPGFDADNIWIASGAPVSLNIFANTGTSTALGSFQYRLSLLDGNLTNPSTLDGSGVNQLACAPICGTGGDGLVDIAGSGSLLGVLNSSGDRVTDYDATDDFDFALNTVPEPTSLALLGIGLLGVGSASRRRVK